MSGRTQILQRSREIKRRRFLMQILFLFLLTLLAIAIFIFGLYQPGWRINNIKVIGAKSIDQDQMVKMVEENLLGSYFLLAPKDSRFFYPKKELAQKIATTFPRVRNLELKVKDSVLVVNLTERESELLWCLVDDENKKDCYFTDDSGVAFAEAPSFDSHVLFEVHVATSSISNATSSFLGVTVLEPKDLAVIYEQKDVIIETLAKQKMFAKSNIVSVDLKPGEVLVFRIVSPVVGEGTWQLLTSTETKGEMVGKLLETLFASVSFIENVEKSDRPLDYIDARLTNKVFFKLKP